MKESEITTKVLDGLKWAAFLRAAGQTINWGMSIIVIHYIKPEEYGLKSMAEIFMGLFIILSTGGLESAIIHTKELNNNIIQKIFGLLILINFFLFAAQVFAAYPISVYYKEPKILSLVQVMSIGFLLIPFSAIPSALLSRDMEYKIVSSVSLFSNIIGGISTLILAIMAWGTWSLIIGSLITSLLNAILLNIYKPCLKFPKFSFRGISEMSKFGGTIVLTSLFWIIFSKADIFIAGRFLSAHEVGIYAVSLHFASLPIDKIVPILNQVAFPAYSKLKNNPELISKYFLKSIRLTSLILFPISFGLVGISNYLIPILLGEKWSDVSTVLLIVGLIFPLRGISALCAPMTNALGYPNIQFNLVFMATLIMIPAFIFGINYGVIGLALTWVFVYPFIMFSNLLISIKKIKISFFEFMNALLLPIVISGIMLYALRLFSNQNIIIINHWFTIALMIAAGAAIYLLGILIVSKNRLYELIYFFSSKSSPSFPKK